MSYLESKVRAEICDVFRASKHLCVPLETGSTYKGVPDLMIFMGTQPAFFIELKSTNDKNPVDPQTLISKMSPEQVRFAERMFKRKQKYVLVSGCTPTRGCRVFNIGVPQVIDGPFSWVLITNSGTKKESLHVLLDRLTKINYTIN